MKVFIVRKMDYDNTLLHYACSELLFFAISELISQGADVNALNVLGETPLACAISHSYRDPEMAIFCVSMLVLAGADPNLHGPGSLTPLMLASIHQNVAIQKLLLDTGANPNIPYTPPEKCILEPGSNALSLGFQLHNDVSSLVPLILTDNGSEVLSNAFSHCSALK
jgi:ankyrin repeat protein